jgi:hypothetical protein
MTNTNTQPTDLPKGWVEVKLGTLFEFEYGKGLTKNKETRMEIFQYMVLTVLLAFTMNFWLRDQF